MLFLPYPLLLLFLLIIIPWFVFPVDSTDCLGNVFAAFVGTGAVDTGAVDTVAAVDTLVGVDTVADAVVAVNTVAAVDTVVVVEKGLVFASMNFGESSLSLKNYWYCHRSPSDENTYI